MGGTTENFRSLWKIKHLFWPGEKQAKQAREPAWAQTKGPQLQVTAEKRLNGKTKRKENSGKDEWMRIYAVTC